MVGDAETLGKTDPPDSRWLASRPQTLVKKVIEGVDGLLD